MQVRWWRACNGCDLMTDLRTFKNNAGFLTDIELRNSFIVRKREFHEIQELLERDKNVLGPQILITGGRGSGKTMLLHRIAADVRSNPQITGTWIPILFPDDSYIVTTPGDFWLEAVRIVSGLGVTEELDTVVAELESIGNEDFLYRSALSALLAIADRVQGKFLLLVENFETVIYEQIGKDYAQKLINDLLSHGLIGIIGTVMQYPVNEDTKESLLGNFQEVPLKPLSSDECRCLWSHVNGDELNESQGRPLEILTGGTPRLVVTLALTSSVGPDGTLDLDVEKLVDELTDYYRSLIDELPLTERKAYVACGRLWKPSTARQIAELARLNLNSTSSYLLRLINRGLVSVISVQRRTKFYQPSDSMFSIFCLVRNRGVENSELSKLLYWINYYGSTLDEIDDRLSPIISENPSFKLAESNLRQSPEPSRSSITEIAKQKDWTGAWETCSDMIEFVTQNPDRVEEVIEWAQQLTHQHPEDYSRKLTYGVLLGVCQGKSDEAFKYLAKNFSAESPAPTAWIIAGDLFRRNDEWELAEKCYQELITRNPNNHIDWMGLGLVYQQAGQYEKAVTAYRKSLEIFPSQQTLLCSLAELLHKEFGKVDEAAETYFEALGWGPLPAYHLAQYSAFLLEKKDDPEKALNYADQYISYANWDDEEPWVTVELFAALTVAGYGPESLDILTKNEASEFLEPLILGINLYLGDEITASPEVKQIAQDIHAHIKERKVALIKPSERKGESA